MPTTTTTKTGQVRRVVDRRRILDPDIATEIFESRDREFPLGFRT